MAIVCCSSLLNAQCLEKNIAFQSGEELEFTGYYNLGFIWVPAGAVSLKTTLTTFEGKVCYKFRGEGKSLKAFDWFFKLRDTLTSYADTSNLKPLYFDRYTHEGNYIAHHQYKFNWDNHEVYSNIKKRNRAVKKDTVKLSSCTFDILSISYFARNIDFSIYKKGDKIPISMLIDNEVHNLFIRYKGLDVVKSKTGERFECLKFSPLLVGGTMFSGGEDMTVWISNDDNRIPIMIEAKILVGSVKGMLTSYKGLRSTKNSFFKKGKGRLDLSN